MTAAVKGLVNDWIEFSAVDGPGNRFVLFLQGCTFNCVACHNPYTINVCNDCGLCLESCDAGALSLRDGAVVWDAAACTGSDACTRVCPYDASPKARRLSVAQVLDAVRPAAPFLSGVTVSGGEATAQPEFLAALFASLKADPELARLTCFVDTNGDAPPEVWDLLDPVLDAAMVDLKALDAATHRRLTGEGNERVRASIRLLAQRGKLHEVRLMLAAGANDDPETLAATGAWLASIDPRMRVKVIGYRAHGVRPLASHLLEPTAEQRAHYADALRAHGDFEIAVV